MTHEKTAGRRAAQLAADARASANLQRKASQRCIEAQHAGQPIGARCNLACEYCYYLDKPAGAVMDDALLEQYTRQVIAVHGLHAEIEFAWHGGEPTLAGAAFFEKALGFQAQYDKGRIIRNTMQTNATLLNDELCRMFKANGFLLGVSIDGPEDLHNRFRGATFHRVMQGVELLEKHSVPFNTLTAVHAGNYGEPERVYRFLRELTDHMQFLPVVELLPAIYEQEAGRRFAQPPGVYSQRISRRAAAFSLPPEGIGAFLCGVLALWKREDAGKKSVQLFESTMGALLGQPASFAPTGPSAATAPACWKTATCIAAIATVMKSTG